MKSLRIEKLKDFLKEDPDDAFTLYALAGEYASENPEEALKYYEKLLEEHENYFATYYHAANLYATLGKRTKAENIFKKGIQVCQNLNERHALSELQSAYNNFLFEQDDF